MMIVILGHFPIYMYTSGLVKNVLSYFTNSYNHHQHKVAKKIFDMLEGDIKIIF